MHPAIVFETANSHGGDLALMHKMVRTFGKLEYSPKHIKFQAFNSSTIALSDYKWFSTYLDLDNTLDDWCVLVNDAATYFDGVWLDIFDTFGVNVYRQMRSQIFGLKLQASVLHNMEILRGLAHAIRDKKLVINISGFPLLEIESLVDHLTSTLSVNESDIILQVGFQAYPTSPIDSGVHKLMTLKQHFPGIPLSFADHTDGNSAMAFTLPLIASMLGATYIEKHICLDRASAKYDGFSSFQYTEMSELLTQLTSLPIGNTPFVPPEEHSYLQQSQMYPLVSSSLSEGSFIKPEDLVFRRTSKTGFLYPELLKVLVDKPILANDLPQYSTVSHADLRKPRIAAFVACRLKSARLPEKALRNIGPFPSIDLCLKRVKEFPSLDHIILTTSYLDVDKPLYQFATSNNIELFEGDPVDMTARFLGASSLFDVDIIVRVTGDCPLISREIYQALISSHLEKRADYTYSSTSPIGLACEIINVSALKRLSSIFGGSMPYSEYMALYFRNNPTQFSINEVILGDLYNRDYRLTLDYQEDLELFQRLYLHFGPAIVSTSDFDLISYLDCSPELSSLNKHCQLVYEGSGDTATFLQNETTLKP